MSSFSSRHNTFFSNSYLSETESRLESLHLKWRSKQTPDFVKKASETHFWNKLIAICLAPPRTAPSPRSTQPPLRFGLPQTRDSECRYDKFFHTFAGDDFSLLLSVATVSCFTDLLIAMFSDRRRWRKSCYRIVHRTGFVLFRYARI